VIAYGLRIGTWVEMSTLGENGQRAVFSVPESCAPYRDSRSGTCGPTNNTGRIFGSA
jgi:hypothetical protein